MRFIRCRKYRKVTRVCHWQKNDNLLSHEESWHTLWGNLGFQHCQWLGRTYINGNLSIKVGSTTVNPPPCAAFQLGKNELTTKGSSWTDNQHGWSIKFNQLEPGDLIFFDQYKSRFEDCHFTTQGHSLSTKKYRGNNLFCDVSRGKVIAIYLVGLTGTETIRSKIQFEQEAADVGVPIKK